MSIPLGCERADTTVQYSRQQSPAQRGQGDGRVDRGEPFRTQRGPVPARPGFRALSATRTVAS